jgi:hypothetical protein
MHSTRFSWLSYLTIASFLGMPSLPDDACAAEVTLKAVMVTNEDPVAGGKAAAEQLLAAMGPTQLKAVIVSECYEDRDNKSALLKSLCAVLPKDIVFGAATYGSFTQAGCTDYDAVGLLGLGGDGLQVDAQLVTAMGTAKLTVDTDKEAIAERLHKAGAALATGVKKTDRDRLLVLLADAHSPKNQYLVEGLQQVLGKDFPITGGCANKNAGQTFVYYQGEIHDDSAVALMLSGDFAITITGKQANVNDLVISTARDGASDAIKKATGKPVAVLAFNCAGRRSKLKKYEDELQAMQDVLGKNLVLFGCYCAGEMGPIDDVTLRDKAPYGGSGWHVMFTVVSQK